METLSWSHKPGKKATSIHNNKNNNLDIRGKWILRDEFDNIWKSMKTRKVTSTDNITTELIKKREYIYILRVIWFSE